MEFNPNSFAVLDAVGDDDSELPIPAAASKRLPSPAPASKEELFSPQPPLPQSQYGRGRGRGRGRGAQAGQQIGLQKIQGGQNSRGVSYGYRRYDGQVYQIQSANDGHRCYSGQNEGYHRYNRRADDYQEQNGGDNGFRKNSICEKNNADSMKPCRRDSCSAYDNGSEQGQRHVIGGGRTKNFNEDSQPQSKLLEGDSGASQEKLPGDKLYAGDANQVRNQRFNSSWNRGGNSENWNHDRRSFARHGNGEVKAFNRKETLGDNELRVTSSGESAYIDREESHEAVKEAERKGSEEACATTIESKEQIEEKEMTLREYEKQLLEKKKALEALKTEERKVTLDKDFESMQLVGRKKEGSILENLNSEKEKLKKEDSLEKDGKLPKSMSIEEFRRKYGSGGNFQCHGRGSRGYRFGEGHSRHARKDKALDIEDSSQFPGLGASVKVA